MFTSILMEWKFDIFAVLLSIDSAMDTTLYTNHDWISSFHFLVNSEKYDRKYNSICIQYNKIY